MYKLKHFYCTILLINIIFLTGFSQPREYQVKLSINGEENSSIQLATYHGDKIFMLDTIRLDENGTGTFHINETLPAGLYLVLLPGKRFFEILLEENKSVSIQTNASGYLENMDVSGSPETQAYAIFQHQLAKLHANGINLTARQKDEEKKIIKEAAEKYKGSFFSSYARALLEPEISLDHIPNRIERFKNEYQYRLNHFFDNIDFTESALLRSPVYPNRLDDFFNRLVIKNPDTLVTRSRQVLKMCMQNPVFHQYTLDYLLMHFKEMINEDVSYEPAYIEFVNEHFIESSVPWIDPGLRNLLKEELASISILAIGTVAPDIYLPAITGKRVNLKDIEANYLIVYFWEPDCSFCRYITPRLKTMYDSYKHRGLEILAVDVGNSRSEWEKYIAEHKLNWINVFDPSGSAKFREDYNLTHTPETFILDEEKRIMEKHIFRPEDIENKLERLFDH